MPRTVRVRELARWVDPERVFLELTAGRSTAAWLDGGIDAVSGRSVIAVVDESSPELVVHNAEDPRTVLDDLAARLAALRAVIDDGDEARDGIGAGTRDGHGGASDAERTALGWIGWFGYEFGARALGLPVAAASTPDAAFVFVERVVVFDHAARRVRLEWLDLGASGSASGAEWADVTAERIERLADVASTVPSHRGRAPDPATPAPTVDWRHDDVEYARMIAECRAAIVRGDAYQLCLTNRVDVDVRPDPVEAYLRLRRSSPSHHGGFLRFGDVALLSASPEQFLFVERDGTVSTRPMKGTRRRDADAEIDRMLRAELAASDKERAENLMIVDLMRNDLTRIAAPGSVHVPVLLETEEYAHVHQLVSTVSARLRPPLTAVDAVAAAFPAGSMTGAPKESAMRILYTLERGPRGVYSGAFGTLAVDGSADLAMVIRSIVLTADGASIGTGGGITALSEPEAEIEETRIKARALLEVLLGSDSTG
ncbi:aminodeoxychorismate synthase component I [Agromyces sp. LHK192]|uniref:aminodeoxychorismate synthase component I n=1 Tax=Agromyces sp. LHK192 TaxID=2498704 RepID=UPI000FDCDC9E|nr:aminodeoxychorismate synthase component I [Agromyces sp. LHK192]